MEPIAHGGALDAAIAEYGGERAEWIDLSTGINPTGCPVPDLADEVWQRLPEESLCRDAVAAARGFYSADAAIVPAPGTQATIQVLPELLPAGPVAVLGPTYGEHARVFRLAGRDVVEVSELEEVPANCSVCVVVNPNNPDGRAFGRDTLLNMASQLRKNGGCLVVDEAFADAGGVESCAPFAGEGGLLVLKSFGKFFGLAGLRLGFAITDTNLAAKIETRLGPWAVSGPALAIAANALADRGLIGEIRRTLITHARLLERTLHECGLEIVGKTDFFVLISDPDARRLHDLLCRHKILAREFDYAPEWLRLGLPASDAERTRLEAALRVHRASLVGDTA